MLVFSLCFSLLSLLADQTTRGEHQKQKKFIHPRRDQGTLAARHGPFCDHQRHKSVSDALQWPQRRPLRPAPCAVSSIHHSLSFSLYLSLLRPFIRPGLWCHHLLCSVSPKNHLHQALQWMVCRKKEKKRSLKQIRRADMLEVRHSLSAMARLLQLKSVSMPADSTIADFTPYPKTVVWLKIQISIFKKQIQTATSLWLPSPYLFFLWDGWAVRGNGWEHHSSRRSASAHLSPWQCCPPLSTQLSARQTAIHINTGKK